MTDETKSKQTIIKVYVVLQHLVGLTDGKPNVRISAVKLTRKAADEVASKQSRSWVVRHFASK